MSLRETTRRGSTLFLFKSNRDHPNPLPNNHQVIDITVEFSDELLLDTSSGNTLPTLPLNNGGVAELVGGTGTREWMFSYTFPEDATAAAASGVGVLDIAAGVPVMIDCTGGCRAANWNGVTADLTVRQPACVEFLASCDDG